MYVYRITTVLILTLSMILMYSLNLGDPGGNSEDLRGNWSATSEFKLVLND